MSTGDLIRRVQVARGEAEGDLLLADGEILNVFTGAVERGDVVIADGWIAGIGQSGWAATETIDVSGRVIAPGLIDGHMHIESTLLVPGQLARLVVPRGTSALIADPHEIGNVMGERGIEEMLRLSEGLPLDCFFMAPSCVPASPFERSGAVLDAAAITRLLDHERVLGLAEMMNFPGVLAGDAEVLAKVASAHEAGRVVDGHCPGLLGRDLVAYAAAGIRSDHECTTPEEALERARLGFMVQVREGTMARNLDALLPLMVRGELGDWCLCTDDVLPEDLVADGHLDGLLRRVVAAGVPAADAVRHATLVPARHYGLPARGAVTPGYLANLVVFDDLESFATRLVLHEGRVVAQDGAYVFDGEVAAAASENTVHLGPLDPAAFTLETAPEALVIAVVPDQIVTRAERRSVRVQSGRWVFDPEDDVALVTCIQRHEPTGQHGMGLVSGFGFRRRGAVGSSVGHDAHNLVIAGTHAEDLVACAHAIEAMGGGFVAVADGVVTAEMPLPVAGLMSAEPVETVCRQQQAVNAAAAALGCPLHSPFGTLSFLTLTVIPELRITDDGLFDVTALRLLK